MSLWARLAHATLVTSQPVVNAGDAAYRPGASFVIRRKLLQFMAAAPFGAAALPQVPARGAAPAHIIVVLIDDLDAGSVEFMPITQQRVFNQGARCTQFFATTPLCAPSRATLLTGKYAHNHGVLRNTGDQAGYRAFRDSGAVSSTIATTLQGAGYSTALIGKFLNGYPLSQGDEAEVPPGWNHWVVGADREAYTGENYLLNEDGAISSFGQSSEEYLTNVLADRAVAFLANALPAGPTFLLFAPYAPHQPANPAPEDRGTFSGAQAPRGASFNERRTRAKPRWVRKTPRFTDARIVRIDQNYQNRLEALQAVDRAIGRVLDAIDAAGAAQNTYVVFLSDNGYFLGEHRQPHGKDAPYDAASLVPAAISGPGIPAGSQPGDVMANIDLAPTFLDMAGLASQPAMDGRSLLPVLKGAGVLTRRYVLLEGFGKETEGQESGELTTPPFQALRSSRILYASYETAEKELYDKQKDAAELNNRAGALAPELRRRYEGRLQDLSACAGPTCRDFEDAPIADKKRRRRKPRRRKRHVNG